MNRRFGRYAYLSILIGFGAALSGCSSIPVDSCVKQKEMIGQQRQGFELINLKSGEVWLTRDWDLSDYEEFELPTSWIMWRKNDPRTGSSQAGKFVKSPGCEVDQYTYTTMFDRRFLHVVNLEEYGIDLDAPDDLLRGVRLVKYHIINFEAGDPIELLTSPSGERYVLVAETLSPASDTPTIPEGWSYQRTTLETAAQIELSGQVTVIRTDNEDSFQGPVIGTLDLASE